MKKILIFLSLFTVFVFAVHDYNDYFKQLRKNVAVKTPAQVEMKKDILKQTREETKNILNTVENPQQNNLFNEKVKDQQNNNIPQFKQRNPLDLDRK